MVNHPESTSSQSPSKTRSEYLQGKTELSDIDIINILDLPVEKRSANNEIYTDKSYKELKNNPEELSSLTENLKTKPEYLKYHSSYIAKSKLLYQESDVLCNEIPCLIVLDQLKKTAYLLPYEYAANKYGAAITSADALKSNTFTDFKRVFNSRLKKLIEKGIAQGKDIFFLINSEKLNYEETKKQLIKFTNNRTSKNKEGTYLFFSEKDFVCYSFESDKDGFVRELSKYDLKEIRAAISSKPLTPNQKTDVESVSSSSNVNVPQENSVVNKYESDLFNSLLLRGEISSLEILKDIENRQQRYFNALNSLEKLNHLISSKEIKESNNKFVKKHKESRFYKDVQNLFIKTANQLQEKPMENQNNEPSKAELSNFESKEYLRKIARALTPEKQKRYFTFNETDTAKFKSQVDEWNSDKSNIAKLITVGKIPPVMKVLGFPDNPIEIQHSTLSKVMRQVTQGYPNEAQGHALSVDDIYSIPKQLADPVMVFKSRTRNDSYVFFTERKDSQNRSILIPMAVNKRKGRIVINEITSMYGRNNEIDFVKTNIEERNLIYADKKRSTEWERSSHVQFVTQRLSNSNAYDANILTKENIVKFISTDVEARNLQEKNYTKVAVGVEPTIWMEQKAPSIATMLRASTTLATGNIQQNSDSVKQETSELEHEKQPKTESSNPQINSRIQEKPMENQNIEPSKTEFSNFESEEHLRKIARVLTPEEQKRYFTFNETDTAKFKSQVDEWKKSKDENSRFNPGKLIEVGKIPPLFNAIGIADNPIEVQYSTLSKMVRPLPEGYPNEAQGHALSVDDIYDIPCQLADPVMVFKSRTRDDSYVFFTERKDSQNRSILIPMAVNKRKGRIVINEITSMYGRNNEIEFVKTNIDEGNLIYADKKKASNGNVNVRYNSLHRVSQVKTL